MCNCMISMCISCRDWLRKESSCTLFDRSKTENNYTSIYEPEWMTEHVKSQPSVMRVDFRFKFCPRCTTKDKPGFRPDVKKVCKSAEKATKDCLGAFVFTYTNGKVINRWVKTEFGKVDPDMYMTTDAETTEDDNDNDDDDDDDDDESGSDNDSNEDEEEQGDEEKESKQNE